MHGPQYGWSWGIILLMFIVGFTLTAVREWTGSVVPGVLLHVGYNLTLFVAMCVATGGFRHLEKMTQ